MKPIVVFSDIDGALRNPSEPWLTRAAKAIKFFARYRIWTVFCSGMTRAEIELLQRDLHLRQPFIAESGAAMFIPRGYFGYDLPDASDDGKYLRVEFAPPHVQVVQVLRDTAARVGINIVGFSDMSAEDVARECGLALSRAQAAKVREYSEPIRLRIVNDEDRDRLIAALDAAQLGCVSRGPFAHVGTVANCATSVAHLRERYEQTFGPVATIGIVDAMADHHLLLVVDHKVMLHANVTTTTTTQRSCPTAARICRRSVFHATSAGVALAECYGRSRDSLGMHHPIAGMRRTAC